ncbi:lectin [Amycolatopsis saalfeldensis]|uniref:Alpha-1,2-mannosidase, putative n=1 Tax=Amycolatopsis saalfeldensis TaxID=394193 RepID=A0A1H8U7R0_9PSEU|nr:lectin [Amycolatopsis saalfeldensis]SEO98874.1 alpha-1,2-mannosidase, putative [Amycolatopsis saalfeldensis]
MGKRRLLLRLSGAGLLAAALAIPVSAPAGAATLVSDPASLVNPFIGTSNQADDFPGADVPFGMVQWSPDTPSRPSGGGYEYNDNSITGFSLTHLSGPGCGADGDVPILPTVGGVDAGAKDSFSHANESGTAGYYSVGLDNGVKTELTAALRSGMAKFTFPSSTQSNLVFKLNGSQNGTSDQTWNVVSPTEVSGSVTSGHFCGAGFTYTLYFDLVFDRPFATSGTAAAPAVTPKAEPGKLHGQAAAAKPAAPAAGPASSYVRFDTTSNPTVQAQVGVSYVSVANAVANRAADLPSFDFAGTKQAAHESWNSMLGRIQVGGGTAAQQRIFYTALYHSLLHPNVFSDSNGQYIGFDTKVHTVASGHKAQYANFSGWDIYRTQAQLSALVAPAETGDIAQSMITDYDQGGTLPKWAQNNGETDVMVGDPAAPILANYYAFGARGFDTAAALAAMEHQASEPNNDRPWLTDLNSPGYIPGNVDSNYECCNAYGPVSTQLEYDSADFAVSAFAGALGDTANQAFYAGRAQNWKNTFNPASGFMQPKDSSGAWSGGFDPKSQSGFVEGTSWQYTGMVPFDVAGLAKARGGNASLISYLDSVLSDFHYGDGSKSDLGNEPSLELPWEYDYVGQPYKTQKVVRQAQDQIWTDAPGGLAGNDDLGAMSAWYVFSALGFYPMTPGTADLALGSPLFTQSVTTLPSGKTLTVNAPTAADNAPYVQSATWNGGAWNNAYVPTSAITAGGTLAFTLGTTANTGWAASGPPPSYESGSLPHLGTLKSGIAGKCADVSNSGTASPTKVQVYTCNPTGAQQWYAAPDGSLQAEGGCLDVSNSGTAEDTPVQRWHCNGSVAQVWQPGANGSLVNPNSGRCLDDPQSSTVDGTQLQIHTCNGTAAQSWAHG